MKSKFLHVMARFGRPLRQAEYARDIRHESGYAGYTASSKTCACPRCQGPAPRIPRRLPDLLLSMFRPVTRHRCHAPDCGWSGIQFIRRRNLLIRGPW